MSERAGARPPVRASRKISRSAEQGLVRRRLVLLLVAVMLGGLTSVPVSAQTRACLTQMPTFSYSASQMAATWAVDARPCTNAGSSADLDVQVTIHRCTANECTATEADRRCRLRSGWCRVTVVAPHAPVEVAEYRFSWQGWASSRNEVTGRVGATASVGPDPCVTAAVVVRDCTKA